MGYNNQSIAVLKYSYESRSIDIGKWEVYYDKKRQFGSGIKEFKDFCDTLPQDKINVIYVKGVKLFYILNKNHELFKFTDGKLKSDGNKNYDFFTLTSGNIEFREWNNWFDKIDDCEEFFNYFYTAMNYLNQTNLEVYGIYTLSHAAYKYGLLWRYDDFIGLNTDKAMKPVVERCVPKDEFILNFYENYYRGGLAFYNPFAKDIVLSNVLSADKKSCHLGAMVMERFPLDDFQEIEPKYFNEVENDFEDTAFIAQFRFKNLRKENFSSIPTNIMYQFGGYSDVDGNWEFCLNEIDWKWFKNEFTWKKVQVSKLYVAQKKYLPKDVIKAFCKLYEEKEQYPKGTAARAVAKQITELPYGQSIKKTEYEYNAEIDENGEVVITKNNPLSFKQKQAILVKRRFPLQLGIWTVSYSRLDIWKSLQIATPEKTIYCDTDCNKNLWDKSIVDRLNAEIEAKVARVKTYCNIDLPLTIGRWDYEYTADEFIVSGIKWYAYKCNGETRFKAAGAQLDVVRNWFKTHDITDFNSQMECEQMFSTIKYDLKNNVATINYSNYFSEIFMGEQKLYSEAKV